MNVKATPYLIYEVYRGLERPFKLFAGEESIWSLCRYIVGLLADVARKTCRGIADAVPGTSSQRLQELLTNTNWGHDSFSRERVGYMCSRATCKDGSIIVDDTGLPKQGKSSCGVARQYSGTLRKVGNCQVIASTQCADDKYNWPVNARLYLPEEWANNLDRRKRCHVPEDVRFMTKIEITLGLIDEAAVSLVTFG
ncbi:MAG: transposase [Bacteroidota bacterium]